MNPEQQKELLAQALLSNLRAEMSRPVPAEYEELFKHSRNDFIGLDTVYAHKITQRVLNTPELPKNTFEYINPSGYESKNIEDRVPIVGEMKEFIKEHPELLTEMGKLLQDKLKDGRVVDFGAGNPRTPIAENWAQVFGAKEYIGFDMIYADPNNRTDYGVRLDLGFSSFRIREDSLKAAAELPENSVDVINISGMDRRSSSREAKQRVAQYIDFLIKEVARILKPGGIIMTGPGCDDELRSRDVFTKHGLERRLVALPDDEMKSIDKFATSEQSRDSSIANSIRQNGFVAYEKK